MSQSNQHGHGQGQNPSQSPNASGRHDQNDLKDDLDLADESKYLLFRLGDELYGTPLLGVREVLQPQNPKAIPNTVPHFMGLINIRGQIIGVVDLRIRFEYEKLDAPTRAYLVFETETGPIAAIVDKVEAVVRIDEGQMHKKPNIRSQVPVQFLIGAANHLGTLVTLIDLNKTLSKEDYVQIQKAKLSAAG
jgi:purine-binding chemotaxis protein CheW